MPGLCWQVLLLAMDVARAALQALQQTSAVLDIHGNRIKPSVWKKTSVEPVPPETPQLLLTIHSLWSPLVNSLKVPVVILPALHLMLARIEWCDTTGKVRWSVMLGRC